MPRPGPGTKYKYSDRFKATAVRLSQLRGVSVQEVAESLYAFIGHCQAQYSIRLMCRLYGVSVSGYYACRVRSFGEIQRIAGVAGEGGRVNRMRSNPAFESGRAEEQRVLVRALRRRAAQRER